MNPDQYAAARHSRLVERALGAGRPEAEAVALVDEVLDQQRSRIRRAADPDPLVTDALDRALAGRPPRHSPARLFVATGLVLVVVVAAILAVMALTRPATTAVPPLFGYDARTVTARLAERGLRTRLVRVGACLPGGEIVGSRPRPGASTADGSTVVVDVSVPLDEACMPDFADRTAAWRVVRWALLGHRSDLGPPDVAAQLRIVTISAATSRTTTLSSAGATDPARLADALPELGAFAQRRVTTFGGLPWLVATATTPRPDTCGLTRPALVGGRAALRVTLSASDDVGDPGADCLTTLDLYRRRGALDTVVVYLPRG